MCRMAPVISCAKWQVETHMNVQNDVTVIPSAMQNSTCNVQNGIPEHIMCKTATTNSYSVLLKKIIKFFDKSNKYEKWQLSPPKKK